MRTHRRGFTLIEVILVVVIISLLAALVLPRLLGRSQQAREGAALSQISSLKTSIGLFETDVGRLPTDEEGLRALVERPASLPPEANWQPYLDEGQVPDDPWGNAFIYRRVEIDGHTTYELFSPGPDGQPGTQDDIGKKIDN